MRVVGTNPLREEVDSTIPDVDPETWRFIKLHMTIGDQEWLQIELLRPLSWIDETSAKNGGVVYLDLPELGVEGDAKVESIEACPEIENEDGTGRNVITGRFIHGSNGNLLNLYIAGESEPTGVTKIHPYWSVDRQKFVKAVDLKPGEQVDTLHGFKKIVKILPRPRDELVYNLEVHREHVYRVGESGTLVHNNCNIPLAWTSSRRELYGKGRKHFFSEKHIDAGLMNLGTSQEDIFNRVASVVGEANTRGFLRRNTTNQIHTEINGHFTTVRAFIDENGRMQSLNAFVGRSGRDLGNVIEMFD